MSRAILYLPDGLRQVVESGRHPFLARLRSVLEGAGMEVSIRSEPRGVLERGRAAIRGDWSLVHMARPAGRRCLTFRRAYHYPFWRIERRAERWEWEVAHAAFGEVPDRAEADRFYGYWRTRLFGKGPEGARREGMIFVPLQGRLRERRSFQSLAPVEMVREVIAHAGRREVVVSLHPNERLDAADLAALEGLGVRPVTGGMEEALARCDLVVTENSSVAFNGYLFGKPAVLFARSDFHHIALDGAALGMAEAMRRAETHAPDYAGYLWWFWQKMALNAGRPEIEERIAERLRQLGWPV
ncbi:hypothetical protein [Histidinibacterium lentulum]|uniref:Capsular biosynthesis protein n=1 Tax=Histidinibacterium lentulum TaxID=2480588 RepID=A0A3N2R775_9RHOB|nr:hypothetical protein [Histidinibacterium lentulum]ROU03176.1 hypothetical protein EAT49_07765 [Histidinibacterium lentulum]